MELAAERRARLLNNGRSRLEKITPKIESSSPTKRKESLEQPKLSTSSISPTVFSSSPPAGLLHISSRNTSKTELAKPSRTSSSGATLKPPPSLVLKHRRKILFVVALLFGLLAEALLYWFAVNMVVLLYCWIVDPATRDVFKHLLNVIRKPVKESIGVIIVLLLQQAPVVKMLFVDFIDAFSLYIVIKGVF